jgi:hypothetical protein
MVVSEKGTIRGTLAPVLDEYEVDFLPVGGYASATRVRELAERGGPDKQPLLLLYLGDHDPSGRSMSDLDLPHRLIRYASPDPADKRGWTDTTVQYLATEWGLEVRRIALTEADTQILGPRVSFPAADKRGDPRYGWFVRRYGRTCWELDAMNPNALRDRVRAAIDAQLNVDTWNRYVRAEAAERESITAIVQTWNAISGLARE